MAHRRGIAGAVDVPRLIRGIVERLAPNVAIFFGAARKFREARAS